MWSTQLGSLALVSGLMFLLSIGLSWMLILLIPADFLVRKTPRSKRFFSRHPVLNVCWWIVRNLLGVLIGLAGVVMLFTPGQGLLFIFLGLTLVDFPGKRRRIRQILGRPGLLAMINRIRRRGHQPPLDAPARVPHA